MSLNRFRKKFVRSLNADGCIWSMERILGFQVTFRVLWWFEGGTSNSELLKDGVAYGGSRYQRGSQVQLRKVFVYHLNLYPISS